jgi:hypothetical protein
LAVKKIQTSGTKVGTEDLSTDQLASRLLALIESVQDHLSTGSQQACQHPQGARGKTPLCTSGTG